MKLRRTIKHIVRIVNGRPLVLGLLSGLLLASGYRVPYAWPILFIALVPLIAAVYQAGTPRKVFAAGSIAGIVLMGTAIFWLFNSLPLPATYGISASWIGLLLVTISWLLTIVATGVFVGVWALLLKFLSLRKPLDLAAAAVLWVGAEYARMIAYSVLTFAPTITNPFFFSAGFLGYALMDSESYRQIAAFGGLYTCSLFIVAINLIVYHVMRYKHGQTRKVLLIGIAAVLFVGAFIPVVSIREALSPKPTGTARIAIVSVRVSPALDELQATSTIAAQELRFVHDASRTNPDIVLLPEDSHLFLPFTEHTVGEYLFSGSSAIVTDSGETNATDGSHPIRLYANGRILNTPIRDKQILTPQGEYLPAVFSFFLDVFGQKAKVQEFNEFRAYSSGQGIGVALQNPRGVRATALFCLEVMDPGLAHSIASQENDNVILVPAARLLFKPSGILEQDTLRFARAQAVESDLPLASSVVQGTAFILDPYGRELYSVGSKGISGSVIGTIPVFLHPPAPTQ